MKKSLALLAALLPLTALADDAADLKASAERGKAIFMTTCMVCHQPHGNGLPPVFPPFNGSEYVQGDARRLVAIVTKGLTGPLKVKGMQFNGVLIAVDTQFPQLKENDKLADVLNYIRTAWENKADKPITPDFVQKVRDEFKDRTTPWTEAEILNFK